jgi:hypothetical protein
LASAGATLKEEAAASLNRAVQVDRQRMAVADGHALELRSV